MSKGSEAKGPNRKLRRKSARKWIMGRAVAIAAPFFDSLWPRRIYLDKRIILWSRGNQAMRARLKDRKARHLELLKSELERICQELTRLGALLVVLFGSSAKGDPGLDSDIDLIVVMESGLGFVERTAEIYRRVQPRVGADILVYTPAEFKEMRKHNAFVIRALAEGEILFEKSTAR